mmetsp:Transcript_63732/g.151989  ORF Transcript_63732/g.151989 Transcript_63732/m.151989 type:complete len:285 (-) Transcript_63732:3031-3885(-)
MPPHLPAGRQQQGCCRRGRHRHRHRVRGLSHDRQARQHLVAGRGWRLVDDQRFAWGHGFEAFRVDGDGACLARGLREVERRLGVFRLRLKEACQGPRGALVDVCQIRLDVHVCDYGPALQPAHLEPVLVGVESGSNVEPELRREPPPVGKVDSRIEAATHRQGHSGELHLKGWEGGLEFLERQASFEDREQPDNRGLSGSAVDSQPRSVVEERELDREWMDERVERRGRPSDGHQLIVAPMHEDLHHDLEFVGRVGACEVKGEGRSKVRLHPIMLRSNLARDCG